MVMLLILLGGASFIALLIKGGPCIGQFFCLFDQNGHPIAVTDTVLWKVVTDMPRAKIIWATAQIIGTVSETANVDWPEPFQTLSSIFTITQLNFAEVLPLGCVTRMSFYSQVFASTLVPIAAVALVHMASFLKLPMSKSTLLSRGSAIYWSQLISFLVLPTT